MLIDIFINDDFLKREEYNSNLMLDQILNTILRKNKDFKYILFTTKENRFIAMYNNIPTIKLNQIRKITIKDKEIIEPPLMCSSKVYIYTNKYKQLNKIEKFNEDFQNILYNNENNYNIFYKEFNNFLSI